MDTKEIVITVAAGIALVAAGYLVVRKVLASQSSAASADTPATTVVNQAAPQSYVPNSTAYAPIGAITGDPSKASAPPGVNPSDLNLATVQAPAFQAPAPVNLGTAAANAPPTGSALQPTDTHSSAPALTGNAAIVDAEYMKVFGRHLDDGTNNFWVHALDSGAANTGNLESLIIKGAQGSDKGTAAALAPDAVIKAYG